MERYFDTHAHINTEPFILDIDKTLEEAINEGIDKIGCVGFDLDSNKKALEICKAYPNNVYAIIGLHPCELNGLNDSHLNELEQLLDNENVVALGEIGLDYYWDNIDRNIQKDFFRKQINIAKKKGLPIVIHTRDAIQDTFDILKEEGLDNIDCIMHSYSGSLEMAKEFLKLGCYLSFSGVLTYKNARALKEVASYAPLDKILIETDCPYLTPVPFRGKTNYPQYVKYVAKEIALLKEISEEEVSNQTYLNALRVFKIKEGGSVDE